MDTNKADGQQRTRGSPLIEHLLAGLPEGVVEARKKNTRQDPTHQEHQAQRQKTVGYTRHHPSSATASICCVVYSVAAASYTYRSHCRIVRMARIDSRVVIGALQQDRISIGIATWAERGGAEGRGGVRISADC